MDEQKKQKMMLGALVVAALGAGSVWYMTSGSDGGAAQSANKGPTVRKARKESQQTERKSARRAKKPRKTSVEKATARKERKTAERQDVQRKKRKRGGGKKVKKQSVTPAA